MRRAPSETSYLAAVTGQKITKQKTLKPIIFLRKFKPSTIHSATAKANLMASIASNFVKVNKLIISVSGVGTLLIGKMNLKKRIFFSLYKLLINLFLKNFLKKI